MKSAMPLLLFLLIAQLAVSQPGYPRLIVLGDDTIVAVTVEQARVINAMENEAVRYRDLSDSLYSNSAKKDIVYIKLESVLKLLKLEREGQADVITKLNKLLHKAQRKADRATKWVTILATIAAIEAVIIILVVPQ